MSLVGADTFKSRAAAALADANLKLAIDRTTRTARAKREAAVADWPGFSKARDLGRRIKDHVIENLDHYLLEFERNAVASGAIVHYAASAGRGLRDRHPHLPRGGRADDHPLEIDAGRRDRPAPCA